MNVSWLVGGRIEMFSNAPANLAQRRQNPHERKRTTIDHRGVVHTNLKGPIGPALERHVDTEVPS